MVWLCLGRLPPPNLKLCYHRRRKNGLKEKGLKIETRCAEPCSNDRTQQGTCMRQPDPGMLIFLMDVEKLKFM
uniref:Uncharacterized protein n=1 Tax=Romanomermis culicivorax TaxID=13658 RepID=A0A915JCA4_ROMCU